MTNRARLAKRLLALVGNDNFSVIKNSGQRTMVSSQNEFSFQQNNYEISEHQIQLTDLLNLRINSFVFRQGFRTICDGSFFSIKTKTWNMQQPMPLSLASQAKPKGRFGSYIVELARTEAVA